MSRYVNTDDICTLIRNEWVKYMPIELDVNLSFVLGKIDDAPSIGIVRCQDCMWRDKDNQGDVYCTYVKGLADINDESFCSWGERKEVE